MLPVIVPGVAGVAVETETDRVLAVPEPQALLATTDTLPVHEPVVAVMEVVVDVPAQPVGSVHVYDEAPVTAAML